MVYKLLSIMTPWLTLCSFFLANRNRKQACSSWKMQGTTLFLILALYPRLMLGSKKLETNVLELQYVFGGKPWSKCLV